MHHLGYDITAALKGKQVPVSWDPMGAINPHLMLLGMSGTGKTHTLRQILKSFSSLETPPRIHVFDVHGDIEIENASTVLYSETSGYGINPLEVNPDPHFGGVRKRIESFIRTVEKSTTAFGVKQLAIIRDLMTELYEQFGFLADDPNSWNLNNPAGSNNGVIYLEVPYEQRDKAKRLGARWNPAVKSWYIPAGRYRGEIAALFDQKSVDQIKRRHPTLSDLVNMTYNRMEESFIGLGRDSMRAVQDLHKASARINRMIIKNHGKQLDDDEMEKLDKAKRAVIDAVERYLDQNPTSKTIREAMLYSSYDVITGVYQRLKGIESTGIFKDQRPPFDMSKPILRHNIKPLSRQEQKLFVLFTLERLFERAVQQGSADRIKTVIVLDEAARYFDKDPENPINIIATEGRKFGISLICAAQSPEHFSQDFLSSVASKIVLGIDETFWDVSRKKLNLSKDKLQKVQMHRNLLFQTKMKGEAKAEWISVKL